MDQAILTALFSALGGGGIAVAGFKYLTGRGERGLKVTLNDARWAQGEFAQLRTMWTHEIELRERREKDLQERIDALEAKVDDRNRRIDHLEFEVRALQDENVLLRAEVVRLGGTPPVQPRRGTHLAANGA